MEKSRKGKERGKEFMAQHAILRFEKHKGNPARPLEAHHERQKEQYASNPDIDTSRSKYNFHIVKPEGRYYHFIQSRIEQAGCRTRKDSTRFVDTLITASPEFFKKKPPKEIQEFFQRAADFLIGQVGRENIVSAVVHMEVVFAPAGVNVGVAGVLLLLPFVVGFQRPCRVALVFLKPQNCVLCHSAPFPIPFLSGTLPQENPAGNSSDRIGMELI